MCQDEEDWDGYCIALLPGLAFMECHAVTKERREKAVASHQGDVFRARNHEDQERQVKEKHQEKMANERRHRAAFVASLKG